MEQRDVDLCEAQKALDTLPAIRRMVVVRRNIPQRILAEVAG
jgi:hypothetical protein